MHFPILGILMFIMFQLINRMNYLKTIFFIAFPMLVFAQQNISGTVVDESNNPLLGVNIFVKGTSNGVTSDFDGNFQISVTAGETLVFSSIGFKTQEKEVSSYDNVNVVMVEDAESLEEVIIVGYGSQKKSNVIGSVVSVDVEEANKLPTTNVSELLRGRAAGVQVNLGDARPGGNSNIVIRGNVSVAGGNNPLIIVDGLPFDSLNDISPDDIASIEILKDASATAIYGARASNGVVLITTKSAKEGEARFNYHGYLTTQAVQRNFNLYTGEQFVNLRREANRNRRTGDYLSDGIIFSRFEREAISEGSYINWEDLVLNDARIENHTLSVSKGTDKTKYYSSLTYFKQDGIIPNSKFDRLSFKLNLTQQLTDKIGLDAIINYQDSTQDKETGGLNFTTITPLAKPFDENGNIIKYYLGPTDTTYVNPLWDQEESIDESKINLFDLSLKLNVDLLPNLRYTLKTFQRNRHLNQGVYRSSEHSQGDEGIQGIGVLIDSKYTQLLLENILVYNPELGDKHSLDLTAVQSIDEQKNQYTQLDKSGFTNDNLLYNGLATELLNNVRNVSRRRILSFMGRVRYSFMDKYLMEITMRADGSSVFAENQKWGYFPAISTAWKIHEDLDINPDIVNQLKLRFSIGATGNQGINSLESLGVADFTPYVFGQQVIGGSTASSRLPNPDLKWETTTTANVGLDFGLFRNRWNGTIEAYQANTTDLLLDRSIASSTGYEVIRFNVGELQNRGVEFSLNGNLINNDNFSWDAGFMASSNKNEVVALTGETDSNGDFIDIQTSNRRLSIGQSINNIWLPKYDGIFQVGDDIAGSGIPTAQPGDVRVVDQNGDGQIDNRDNVFTNTDPDWFGSFTSTIRYKNFDLFVDIYTVQGATRLNSVLANGELWKGSINGIVTPYYTPEYPSTLYPRPKPITHAHLYSFAVRDASYLRLRTLSLGYTIPSSLLSNINVKSGRVYFTGTNLLTLTDFKSYSPEQDLFNGVFPETMNLTVGVKFEF